MAGPAGSVPSCPQNPQDVNPFINDIWPPEFAMDDSFLFSQPP
jgi:hypothetical protein